MKLSIILPAYNEERTIRGVLDAVLGVDLSSLPKLVEKEIIVVDDASTDRTAEIVAAEPRVKLVRQPENLGKGAAIRTALLHVTGEVVLIQDGDLEYAVEDYPGLLRPFIECGADVVYGSRFLTCRHPKKMGRKNVMANRILTFVANLLFAARITDEATCFKVFRASLLKSLPLRASRFDFCPEVTALVRLRGSRIYEVPVRYEARTREEGKKIKVSDGIQALKTLCLYRLRGFERSSEKRETQWENCPRG